MHDNWRMTDSTSKVTKNKYFRLPSSKKITVYIVGDFRRVIFLWISDSVCKIICGYSKSRPCPLIKRARAHVCNVICVTRL